MLNASLQDYRGGFPDRAGKYLQDLVKSFLEAPEYASAFSPASQQRLKGFMGDLQEV
jgi:hypothetical protein